MARIVDAGTVDFARRNGNRRGSQFDALIPFIEKLRPGKAVCATDVEVDPRLKHLQSQLGTWLRKRKEAGMIDENAPLSVRRDVEGRLWIVSRED